MNKETIYIEPENDITDILAKLKNSEQKVVALVPPKKAGVLRSAVNIKLIAKTARDAEKAAVLVTADPALIKLAAAAKIPVAKTLQSRPEVPTDEDVAALMANEQVIDDMSDQPDDDNKDDKKPTDKAANAEKKTEDKPKAEYKAEEKPEKKSDDKGGKGKKGGKVPDIKKYRKFIIIGASLFVAIVAFLIWALAIAPKVDIKVSVQTEGKNFSENVTFTTNEDEENVEEGKFFITEQKVEKTESVKFTATGQKDVGNKASGTITVTVRMPVGGSAAIEPGTVFSTNGLTFTSNERVTFSAAGRSDIASCADTGDNSTCEKSGEVSVTASQPGDKFNVPANSSWSTSANVVAASNRSAFSGGSSDIKVVVSQADVMKAQSSLELTNDDELREELSESLKEGFIPVQSSFNKSEVKIESSPAVNEEAPNGGEATMTATYTVSMYAVDRADIEKFIESKIELPDDQKVYSIGDPYFDRFVQGDEGFSAKLKTVVQIGPKITNEEVMDKAKGRKIGEVQSMLKSISGVTDVKIDGNFFWVRSVPSDPNRVNIELTNSSDNNTEEGGEEGEEVVEEWKLSP